MTAQLRVFWPDDLPSKANRSNKVRLKTLSEFYETFVLPSIRRPRRQPEETIAQDRVALNHWKRLTGDPPLDRITPELCACFMTALANEGKKANTLRKIAVHLQFILDFAGPPDRHHRNAAKILTEVPYIERPPAVADEPEPAFTMGEIELLIEASKNCGHSSKIPFQDQKLWWASLIRFTWHTGLRRMNLLNARWSWLTQDGWLVIPPPKYKQNKTGRRFYLSSTARKIAERVRVQGEDRIFAWKGTASYFHERWRIIAEVLPPERRFCTKAIRRAALTWLAERNPLISRLVAGHRKLDVLEDFYIQRDVVIDLLESMPCPKGWDWGE